MMATTVTEASLTCSICLRRFRKPRMLPCLHSYCEECLVEYAPSGTQVLMCPLCQEKIQVPDGNVTKFKLDFRIQSMVEDAHRYDREAGIVSEVQVCNCCKDEGEAIAKCVTCKKTLCKFGLKAHEHIAVLRDHTVQFSSLEDGNALALDQEEQTKGDKFCIEKRAILVSNIPHLRQSPDRIRDRLTMHFQKKRNGGGDVDGILYPLEGCPRNAVVVFTDKQACSSVTKTDQFLEDFQTKVSVEPCPQVFKRVEAEINVFYWNLVPRLASSKLIDELSKLFGKSSLQTTGHILQKVNCNMSQLQEVHSAIVKAVGLSSSDTSYSTIERGLFIQDIPYLTDEAEQLRDELRKHLEMEGTCQLQALLCPIKGGASEAMAIFQTSEDCKAYMEQSGTSFYGESLRVVKLPPVFKHIIARLEDFYRKLIKPLGSERLRSCGLDVTGIDTTMTGNFQEILRATTEIFEIIGLSQYNISLPRLPETDDASTQTHQQRSHGESIPAQFGNSGASKSDIACSNLGSINQPATYSQVLERNEKEKAERNEKENAHHYLSWTWWASDTVSNACGICKIQKEKIHVLEGCGHRACVACIEANISLYSACHVCGALYGWVTEPTLGGLMKYYRTSKWELEGTDAIVMDFDIPSGIQNNTHPIPGKRFIGMVTTTYLPDTDEGVEVLYLIRWAFETGHMFQISSYGEYERVVLGDVPLKRQIHGGFIKNGYPDPRYLPKMKAIVKKLQCQE